MDPDDLDLFFTEDYEREFDLAEVAAMLEEDSHGS